MRLPCRALQHSETFLVLSAAILLLLVIPAFHGSHLDGEGHSAELCGLCHVSEAAVAEPVFDVVPPVVLHVDVVGIENSGPVGKRLFGPPPGRAPPSL